MSLHKSRKGAEMAMEFHKEECRRGFLEYIQVSELDIKFGEDEGWAVREYEIND